MRRMIGTVDTLISPPLLPAVPLDVVKKHIRAVTDQDDVLVEAWVQAASQWIENYVDRQIITATREYWLDRFPCAYNLYGYDPLFYEAGYGYRGIGWPAAWPVSPLRIELPRAPLQSIVSVSYVDGDGAVQVMDPTAYQVKTPAGTHAAKGWVEPTPGTSWPATRLEAGAVRIQYVCGYGDTDDSVPELLKASILYLVATYDQFRVPVFDVRGTFEEVPFGVGAMLDPFKSLPSVVLR